jgi:serine/threonine-protein kinase
MELEGLEKIGRYEIIGRLGQGAAGWVFLGRDPYIKRQVAIKVSKPASDISRESFFVEAQSAGRLNHPNIVVIHDFGEWGEYCYITMEYVDGPTIEQYCRPDALLPPSKVLEIGFQVCQALDAAHRQGVIHRDVKPSNVLLDKNGAAKITDFGIAQIGQQTETTIVGTPYYIAPERLRGETAESASDVYSLACVLYEMIVGRKVFDGDDIDLLRHRILKEPPLPPSQLRDDLPANLDDILLKALSKNPKDRQQNCLDFAYDLRLALRGLSAAPKNARDFFDYVQNVPFFNNFTKDQVRELVTASNIMRVKRDRVIIAEGEVDDTFYIILSGSARVKKGDKLLAVIKAGECFGEMSLISSQPRTATVEAETDCSLMKISATLLNRSPESVQLLFFQNFAKTLVKRLMKSSENE